MQVAAVSPLLAWDNFYVIIGSSAGALTGLMFVVITLIASTRDQQSSGALAAFGTPTVAHFCAALFIAAILSAPWSSLIHVTILLGLAGLWGVAYIIIVARRTLRQTDYTPVLEDWFWHIIFPLVAYATVVVAAILLDGSPTPALFAVAAASVLLLFVGIHNSWDSVTYIAVEKRHNQVKDE